MAKSTRRASEGHGQVYGDPSGGTASLLEVKSHLSLQSAEEIDVKPIKKTKAIKNRATRLGNPHDFMWLQNCSCWACTCSKQINAPTMATAKVPFKHFPRVTLHTACGSWVTLCRGHTLVSLGMYPYASVSNLPYLYTRPNHRTIQGYCPEGS